MFKDFLRFRCMLTPFLIQLGFWLSVAFVIAAGIRELWLDHIGQGLFMIIAIPILFRIIAEFIIVIFRIHNTLVNIQSSLFKHREG